MRVINETRHQELSGEVRLAQTFFQRMRGLLGSAPLEDDSGLWIPHCQGVHTFGMSYTIDAVYLDQTGEVIHLESRLVPNKFGPVRWKADVVLELPAGKIKTAGLQIGDVLHLACDERVNRI